MIRNSGSILAVDVDFGTGVARSIYKVLLMCQVDVIQAIKLYGSVTRACALLCFICCFLLAVP